VLELNGKIKFYFEKMVDQPSLILVSLLIDKMMIIMKLEKLGKISLRRR